MIITFINKSLINKIFITLLAIIYIFTILIFNTANTFASKELNQRDLIKSGLRWYDKANNDCVATSSSSSVPREQKIAQTLIVGFDSQNDAGIKTAVEKYKLGGVFPVGGGSYDKLTKEFFDSLNTAAGAKLFIASDDEGGQVTRLASGFPSATEMGGLTAEAAKAKGAEMGQLLADHGLNADLAPVLDLTTPKPNPSSPGYFMTEAQRTWSGDPAKIISNAGAWAEGLKSKNITPTYKHFPGIGKLTQNTDEGKPTAVNLSDLTEDLKPYRELANKNGGAVMLSNGYVSDWGDEPVSINKKAIEYLRNDIKFTGTITTDALNALKNHDPKYSLSSAIVSALNAGADMPLFVADEGGTDISKNVDEAIKAVAAQVSDERIDDAYEKSLKLRGIAGAPNGTSISSPSTDLSGFDPDPAAIDYYEKTPIQDGKSMKQIIEELKPLYVKAAAAAGLADWEMLPALHNLEFNLGRSNPTTNVTFRTPFQMGESYLTAQGYNLNDPKFQAGHVLTDDEFTEVATIAAKGWIIPDSAGLGFDATRGLTPEQAAKAAVAYKSGGGSVWLNGTLDFKGHAYAWAGYNKNEFKLPMAYAPGSPYGDEKPTNLIDKPGVATLFAILKKSGGGTVTSVGCKCPTNSIGSTVSGGTTIFLDPGHGTQYENIDSTTGLKDSEWPNDGKELADVWEVANNAKKELEQKGYKVIISKDAALGTAEGFRIKAEKANSAKAAIAVSLHTTGGGSYVWHQKVGNYREYNGNKTTFSNADVANKSAEYAKIFTETRKTDEGIETSEEDHYYDGAGDTSSGNIAMIMLFGNKVPWVYLEKGTGGDGKTNRSLSTEEKTAYTKSVVDGVSKAVPASGGTGGGSSSSCSGSGSGVTVKDLESSLKAYVWEDGSHGTSKKPDYKDVIEKRKKENKYVGSDGIDCGGFITTLMQESGLDKEYGNGGPTGTQQKYLEDNANKYQKLGVLKDSSTLKPGDIAIWNAGGTETQGNAGHTYIYTGKIDGFKGNSAQANLDSEAPYSMDAYFPTCEREHQSYCQQFTWYRLINK